MSSFLIEFITPEAIHCGLITCFLYMLPLNKRSHWPLRFLPCILLSLPFILMDVLLEARINAIILGGLTVDTIPLLITFSLLSFLLVILLFTCSFLFCCRLGKLQALYGALCAYLTEDLAYTVFAALAPTAAHRGTDLFTLQSFSLEVIVMAIIYSLCYFLAAKRLGEGGEYRFDCLTSSVFLLTFMIISQILGNVVRFNYDINGIGRDLFTFLFLYDSLLSMMLLVTQVILMQGESYRVKAEMETRLLQQKKQEYQQFLKNIDVINRKSHDLKHILYALQYETNGERKQDLFLELEQEIQLYDSHMDTGSDILDALLGRAWMNCRSQNIQWTCMADGSAAGALDPVDLYVMLGNALDNAVESAGKVEDPEKRFLSVNIWKRGGMCFFRIDNYCRQAPEFVDGLPVTTKENSFEHGIGTRSIRDTAERCGGTLKITVDQNIYSLEIILPAGT